jgi:protein-tyrosine phosphatase
MATTRQPGQNIDIATVPNLRDLGGWPARGGRVRQGLLYRSAEFSGLQGDDAAAFAKLGIRSVYDLRTADERAAQPNVVPGGVEYIIVDVLQDATGAAPAQVVNALTDPALAERILGGGKAVAMFEDGYRQIVGLPSALTGYRQFFTDISQPEHRPAVFHCTTGKDRTGWAAASLLLLLGVAHDDVYADYLLTNQQLVPKLQPMVDQFTANGGDPALLAPVIGVQTSYLDAAVDEMQKRFGSIHGYFADGLGLDPGTIELLRSSYIQAG